LITFFCPEIRNPKHEIRNIRALDLHCMSDRYFIDAPISADRVILAGPEAHHLIHVMRAAAGQRVVLFDGSGAEFPATVERVGRADVELAVHSREEVDRELPLDLTLGVALPKGERQKWLIEKAVELGVTRIVPLSTERAVAQPVESALARLRRSVIEASKQCGRNRLLVIDEPASWPDFVQGTKDAPCRLLAHPQTKTGAPFGVPASAAVTLAIGPEGGFTAEEVALAVAAGWQLIDLGPRILRVETAAVFMAAMVAARRSG
jgi:16S rRNA (uracil1498-N3)-methyltransferase